MTDDDRRIQIYALIALAAFLAAAVYSILVLTGQVEPVELPWKPEGLR